MGFVTECHLVAGMQHCYLSIQNLSPAYLSKLEHCPDVYVDSRDASNQDKCHVWWVVFKQVWPTT